jgi:hypothetical protein
VTGPAFFYYPPYSIFVYVAMATTKVVSSYPEKMSSGLASASRVYLLSFSSAMFLKLAERFKLLLLATREVKLDDLTS